MNIVTEDTLLKEILPITGRSEYLKSLGCISYGWFVDEKFILPYIIEKKAIFKRMVFTTQAIPKIDDNIDDDDEKIFLEKVIEKAKEMCVDFIYQPRTTALFKSYPEGSIFAPFGTYVVDLELDEDQLLKSFHGKHRNAIKKAIKDGVIINSGESVISRCHSIIKDTMERQNRGFLNMSYLQLMSKNMKENVSFYVSEYLGEDQGCAIVVWSKNKSAYYLHGGSAGRPATGANNYLQWEIMLDMKAKGVKYYNFVGARINPKKGSKQEGMQRFKSRFGATLETGYLWKYPIKKYKYWLFKTLVSLSATIKRNSQHYDIIDEENNAK